MKNIQITFLNIKYIILYNNSNTIVKYRITHFNNRVLILYLKTCYIDISKNIFKTYFHINFFLS